MRLGCKLCTYTYKQAPPLTHINRLACHRTHTHTHAPPPQGLNSPARPLSPAMPASRILDSASSLSDLYAHHHPHTLRRNTPAGESNGAVAALDSASGVSIHLTTPVGGGEYEGMADVVVPAMSAEEDGRLVSTALTPLPVQEVCVYVFC